MQRDLALILVPVMAGWLGITWWQAFVKEKLAPYKYPRFIEFLEELPKTATGKIQRFKLRDMETQRLFER